jgi:hypothetical protein
MIPSLQESPPLLLMSRGSLQNPPLAVTVAVAEGQELVEDVVSILFRLRLQEALPLMMRPLPLTLPPASCQHHPQDPSLQPSPHCQTQEASIKAGRESERSQSNLSPLPHGSPQLPAQGLLMSLPELWLKKTNKLSREGVSASPWSQHKRPKRDTQQLPQSTNLLPQSWFPKFSLFHSLLCQYPFSLLPSSSVVDLCFCFLPSNRTDLLLTRILLLQFFPSPSIFLFSKLASESLFTSSTHRHHSTGISGLTSVHKK